MECFVNQYIAILIRILIRFIIRSFHLKNYPLFAEQRGGIKGGEFVYLLFLLIPGFIEYGCCCCNDSGNIRKI